ncbi:MAG: NADH:flavin oxidoreductase, partial [Emticicia sp.]
MAEKFKPKYTRVAQLKTAQDLSNYLSASNVKLDFDDELITGEASPFRKSITLKSGKKIGNALSILPMEGWDGTADGRPSEFTKYRWENFAISGAKLLWGCEAVAVSHEGRANPRQLVMNEANFS